MRRPSVLVHLFVAGLALTAGCSSSGDDRAATTTTSPPEDPATTTTVGAEQEGERDTCPDPAAMGALVGRPVDPDRTGGFRMAGSTELTSISYQYDGCDLELTDDGEGTISVVRITEAEVDGETVEGSAYDALDQRAMADFAADGFGPLTELPDSYRDEQQVVFRTGRVMVFVEVEVDGEKSFDAGLEMAQALADGRVTIPADDLDCMELGALAPSSFGALIETSSTSGSSAIDDLSFDRTGCTVDHAAGHETSFSVTDASIWEEWVAAMSSSGLTAYYEAVEIDGYAAFDDGDALTVDDGDHPWVISTRGDDLGPDPADLRRRIAELVLAG